MDDEKTFKITVTTEPFKRSVKPEAFLIGCVDTRHDAFFVAETLIKAALELSDGVPDDDYIASKMLIHVTRVTDEGEEYVQDYKMWFGCAAVRDWLKKISR